MEKEISFWHRKFTLTEKFWMLVFIPKTYADFIWKGKLSLYEKIYYVFLSPCFMIIIALFIVVHRNDEPTY